MFLMLIIAVKEDFIDQHAVSSIKEKLPYVMPVSCYRLGIDGANIVFQSKVSGITLSLKCHLSMWWLWKCPLSIGPSNCSCNVLKKTEYYI